MNNTSLIINSSKELIGDIMIPGDKSITHRAIILAVSYTHLTLPTKA